MGPPTLPHLGSALNKNALLRVARCLHLVSARRASRTNDCPAGWRSAARTNLDTHGEWRPAFDCKSLSDHGDSVPCAPRDFGTSDSSASRTNMNHIELDGVSKTFGERVVLNDLSLQIEKPERLVLFGPSGCGKTTVLRLIAGLEVPDKGEIRIEDRIVASSGNNLVPPEKRDLGMVFQDLALWPHMTVQQNLMFGLIARKIQKREAQARVCDMLHRVGLEHRTDAKPHQLSGGEQQRVALARALVSRPSILLMDEPLSSLDDERKQTIASDLLSLQSQLCFTLIYVTHDRAETDLLASRVCQMRDGRVA
jgi:iron(III) transport system ATP-binding protein